MNTKIRVAGALHRSVVPILCGLLLAGCGGRTRPETPELVSVSGVIKLDGKPLPKASVIFLPEVKGEVSAGRTNDAGEYSLTYAQGQPGAVVGTHRVEIRTGGEVLDSEGRMVSESREILPNRYHSNSGLTADVKPGSEKMDFNLKSK